MSKNQTEQQEQDQYKDVLLKCPVCDKKDTLKVPRKVINESKQLTTISVPKGLVCDHNFQAYIDKNFIARGYQKIDFEFSQMEFYEGKAEDSTEEVHNLTSLEIFDNILGILRDCVDDKEVIGSAIFTVDGKVLYSSLPHDTLLDTIKEFEVRNQEKLISIRKMFLELRNKQKVCSVFTEIGNEYEVIVVLIFSEEVRLGMGNLLLREVLKKIKGI
jgi:hypothetical protein